MSQHHAPKATADSSSSSPPNVLEFLQREGLLTEEQTVAIREKINEARPRIGEILVRQRYLSMRDVLAVLEEQATHPDCFGEIAIRLGLLTPMALHAALDEQRAMTPDVLETLPDMVDELDHRAIICALGQYVTSLERRVLMAKTETAA